jgi:hypothetical protein
MLYTSIALFVLALVAALFGFALAADPEFARIAQLTCAALFGASVLAFSIDRAWGAYAVRRLDRDLGVRERDSAVPFALVHRRAHTR